MSNYFSNTVAIIVTIILVFALLITAFPGARYFAALLGMGALQILSIRPDRNLDYEIEVKIPTGNKLIFSGKTGCKHYSKFTGTGYKTISRQKTIINNNTKWLLKGINCNDAINIQSTSGYKLYKFDNNNIAHVYFLTDNSKAQIIKSQFESSITFSLGPQEKAWDKHYSGPFFYRKIKLGYVPDSFNKITGTAVVYVNETCGKNNPHGKRHKIPKDDALKYSYFQQYSTGTLKFSNGDSSWSIDKPINLENPLMVSVSEYNKGTYVPKSDVPIGCLRFTYKDNEYLLSQSGGPSNLGGAFLYIGQERSVIQVRKVMEYIFERAVEDESSWNLCGPKSFTTTTNTLIDHNNDLLIKIRDGKELCSNFHRLSWL